MHFVYELINFMGTVEYVGETKNPKKRMYQHTTWKPHPSHKNGKFYGRQDLIMNIVHEFTNRKDAVKLEGELKIIYDITWSEGIRGKNVGLSNSESILAYKTDGTFVGEYYSHNEASRKLGIPQNSISRIVSRKQKQSKGYTFKKKQ